MVQPTRRYPQFTDGAPVADDLSSVGTVTTPVAPFRRYPQFTEALSGPPAVETLVSVGSPVSGGNQTLVPTGPAVFTWVAPTTSLRIPQVLVPTGPAVFTWVAPDASLDRGGQQLHPTGPAVFTWVAPTTTIVGTGSATLVPESVTFFRWRVPNRTLRGGASRPGRNLWHGLPFNKYTAVTPSDTVNLPEMCLALYVGAGGDVVAVEQDGQVRTFVDVPTGSIIAIAAVRVNSTGTSAASIVALNRV